MCGCWSPTLGCPAHANLWCNSTVSDGYFALILDNKGDFTEARSEDAWHILLEKLWIRVWTWNGENHSHSHIPQGKCIQKYMFFFTLLSIIAFFKHNRYHLLLDVSESAWCDQR